MSLRKVKTVVIFTQFKSVALLTPPTAFFTLLYFLPVASLFVNTLCNFLDRKLVVAGVSVSLCLAH